MTDESIFAAALAIPDPAERAAYLDRACAEEAEVRVWDTGSGKLVLSHPVVPSRMEWAKTLLTFSADGHGLTLRKLVEPSRSSAAFGPANPEEKGRGVILRVFSLDASPVEGPTP